MKDVNHATGGSLARFLRRLAIVLLVPAAAGLLAGILLPPVFNLLGLPPDASRRIAVAIGVVAFVVVTRREDADRCEANRSRG